jgi:hypothetical protein
VTLLVLASVLYDGVSQALLAFPSVAAWDGYLNGLNRASADEADLLMSVAMLAFTAAFLLAGRGPQEPASPAGAHAAAKVLNWRILALAALPAAVLTYEGRGYNGFAQASAGPGYASTFFVILVTLASAGFVLRHGRQWAVPALVVQSAVLAAAGERSPVVAGAIGLLLILSRAGMRPSGRQVAAAVAVTGVAAAAIMGVRAQQGRGVFQQATGSKARITALASGVAASQQSGGPGVAAAAAVRLDGTSFAGSALQAEAMGEARPPGLGVPQSVAEMVPHALWAAKPEAGSSLDPYQAQIGDLGMQDVNYLPTLPGLYAGYLPAGWLIVLLAALGLAWGAAERFTLARCTPARLVLLAGLVQSAVAYEGGLTGMLVVFRPALVLAAAAWCWQAMRLHGQVPAPVAQAVTRHAGR